VTTFNANLDLADPRSQQDLKRDLKKWEDGLSLIKNGEIIELERSRDSDLYSRAHQSDFKRLVDDVKQRREKRSFEQIS